MKRIFKLSCIVSLAVLLFSAFISNNKKSRKKPKLRLKSDTIHVVNYAIHLDIIHLSTKTIKGYTEIKLTPKMNNIRFIPLDLLKMTVDSVCEGKAKVKSFFYDGLLLRIPLVKTININDTNILLKFITTVSRKWMPPAGAAFILLPTALMHITWV